jgi:CBS domain-containing protein
MKTRVRDILKRKGPEVVTIEPSATVYTCIERMVDRNVGSILVVDGDPTRGESIVGIFTERDYMRRIVLKGRTSKTTEVQTVMSDEVLTVPPDTSVEACMQLMTEERSRHLPVLADDDTLLGLVSIGDCVKQISDAAQDEAAQLRNYVSDRYPG